MAKRKAGAPRVYVVEWIPPAAVLALAKARGMPEGDDSPMDYCEPTDASETAEAADFPAAVALAKDKANGGDFFGQVEIARLVKIETPGWKTRWLAEAVWFVAHDDEPAEDRPDERPELDLYPHETMPD